MKNGRFDDCKSFVIAIGHWDREHHRVGCKARREFEGRVGKLIKKLILLQVVQSKRAGLNQVRANADVDNVLVDLVPNAVLRN